MGRSVSTPSGASVVVRAWTDHSAYYCRTCAHCREEEIHVDPAEGCPRCAAADRIGDIQHDDHAAQENWNDSLVNLTALLRKAFPSLEKCDKWLDREDHAILSNRHAYVGISEYCGLVAVWIVPTGASKYDDPPATAQHWAAQVERRFRKIVAETYGEGV